MDTLIPEEQDEFPASGTNASQLPNVAGEGPESSDSQVSESICNVGINNLLLSGEDKSSGFKGTGEEEGGNFNGNTPNSPLTTDDSIEPRERGLWGLSQCELICKFLQSQSKVEYLENLCHQLRPKDNESDNVESRSSSEPRTASETKETLLETAESFELVKSPHVTTPPYEYIVLTKSNEDKFRIFVNPKINSAFKEELVRLKSQETGSSPPPPPQVLPLPHNCSDATIVHCFDPSDVDVELKNILKANPPVTHRIVRRKSRLERGSSVPAIDSYYGTQDLERVGHASYFIPDLTPSERKIIGWKEQYSYGLWKYSKQLIPIPGKSFFSRMSLKDIVRKSKSGHKNKACVTTPAAAKFKILEDGSNDVQKIESILETKKLRANKKANSIQNFEQGEIPSAVASESTISSESIISSSRHSSCFYRIVRLNPSRHFSFHKNGRIFQNFVKWLIPCYRPQESPNETTRQDGLVDCADCGTTTKISTDPLSTETMEHDIDSCPLVTSPINNSSHSCSGQQNISEPGGKTIVEHLHHRHHHHHHRDKMLLGCFHYRQSHNQVDQVVVGGDVVLSADDSVISVAPLTIESPEITAMQNPDPIQGNNIAPLTFNRLVSSADDPSSSYSKLESNKFMDLHKSSQVGSSSVSHSSQIGNNNRSASSDTTMFKKQELMDSTFEIGSCSATVSTIQSPSMQVSTNSFCSGHNENDNYLEDEEYIDDDYFDIDDYDNDESPLSFMLSNDDKNFSHTHTFGQQQGCATSEDVFETCPETRFLDAKDLALPRYQYKQEPITFDPNAEYDENYDYEDDDEYDEYEGSYEDDADYISENTHYDHILDDYANNLETTSGSTLNNNNAAKNKPYCKYNAKNWSGGGSGSKKKTPMVVQDCKVV